MGWPDVQLAANVKQDAQVLVGEEVQVLWARKGAPLQPLLQQHKPGAVQGRTLMRGVPAGVLTCLRWNLCESHAHVSAGAHMAPAPESV